MPNGGTQHEIDQAQHKADELKAISSPCPPNLPKANRMSLDNQASPRPRYVGPQYLNLGIVVASLSGIRHMSIRQRTYGDKRWEITIQYKGTQVIAAFETAIEAKEAYTQVWEALSRRRDRMPINAPTPATVNELA